MSFRIACWLLLPLFMAGCEQLGIEDPAKIAAAREAEGKAIGSACRHSGRALEDCYAMNPKAMKAAIFSGWREMDGYMRDNKIEAAVPDRVDAPAQAPAPAKGADKKESAKHSGFRPIETVPPGRRVT